MEWRIKKGCTRKMKKDEEEEIREELRKVVRKLKDGKAPRGVGIPNEVRKYEGEEVEI